VLETNIVVIDNRIPQISLAHASLLSLLSSRARKCGRKYSSEKL